MSNIFDLYHAAEQKLTKLQAEAHTLQIDTTNIHAECHRLFSFFIDCEIRCHDEAENGTANTAYDDALDVADDAEYSWRLAQDIDSLEHQIQNMKQGVR